MYLSSDTLTEKLNAHIWAAVILKMFYEQNNENKKKHYHVALYNEKNSNEVGCFQLNFLHILDPHLSSTSDEIHCVVSDGIS